jgi:DegV family protein with EDD domain
VLFYFYVPKASSIENLRTEKRGDLRMNRLIVTDSTADLPDKIVQHYGIKVMPVNVVLNGKTYKDGVDITRAEFYKKFHDYDSMYTEPVRYEDYALEYLQMIHAYKEIIIIHCSGHLSETVNIARQVQVEFKNHANCRVEVIDSKLCSMSMGMVVIAAAKANAVGRSFDEILRVINTARNRMNAYMAVPTLKYLKKGKKIGGLKALFGLAVGVKPVLEFDDGRMVVKTKLFGKQKNMILTLLDTIKKEVGQSPITLSLIYSGDSSIVINLRDVFTSTFECREVYASRFGPSIGINTGPESYAVFFIRH